MICFFCFKIVTPWTQDKLTAFLEASGKEKVRSHRNQLSKCDKFNLFSTRCLPDWVNY
jgi:hypothetical protein